MCGQRDLITAHLSLTLYFHLHFIEEKTEAQRGYGISQVDMVGDTLGLTSDSVHSEPALLTIILQRNMFLFIFTIL